MAAKAEKAGVAFRPHFKTHQSHFIGQIFRESGVEAITVSSIPMAEYFARDDWKDITIAFPANVRAASHYDQLAKEISLNTLVISEGVVNTLDAEMTQKMGLYIEIDPDYGRSGVSILDTNAIARLKKCIDDSHHFHFAGFYCHAGHTYKARGREEIEAIAGKALDKLNVLMKSYPEADLCFGDTPSCSVLDQFGAATQISPGNFVFYDWMQVQIGACSPNEIAVYMECPVIEKFEDRLQVLIHGGAVHFSKEYLEDDGLRSFGEPRLKYLSKDTYIKSVSQEHGIIQCSREVYDYLQIGDMMQIFPIHSCLTADLMGRYYTPDGQPMDHMNGIKSK